MTEKRFTIKPQDDYFDIIDNNTADKVNVINSIRTEIEAKWLCDLMNELNEENEQLKQRNRELQGELQDANLGLSLWNAEDTILEEDKKQLQKENKELKRQMNRLYNYFWDWHSDEMGGNQFSEMWDGVKEEERWDYGW